MPETEDFFSAYFAYTAETEVPRIFHRWCAIAGIGALLGRSFYFPFGSVGNIYPNIYCMLLGEPGTKKSTAIKMMTRLLLKAGYVHVGPNKTSLEKFLMDLEEGIDYYAKNSETEDVDDILSKNLFGEENSGVAECLVAADEFNNFIGYNNINFISTLGELWDYDGPYRQKLKNSKSVLIYNPTVTILGGNTATNYAEAFPSNVLGQGFFSRLLHIHGEETGIQITFPAEPSEELISQLLVQMGVIRNKITGCVKITDGAKLLIDKIYKTWPGIDDVRFRTYANRRFTHFLKLCLIHTAARLDSTISEYDVVYANTVLMYTEHFMPRALGEFGKSRHSDVSNKIMHILENASSVVVLKDIWKHVSNDLEKFADLGDLMRNLQMADKIQTLNGGFLAKKKPPVEMSNDTIDYGFLTEEERMKT
jgi:hypothetical protein